ncbi:MAG TPA: radical SAM family heme chaperone HemW [Aestuariivirgaceae bacterium]|nr:radical SAM family heme chaperone HemW [Aestuariivirgaceae bacterium]
MPDPLKDLSVYVHWPFCKAKCPYCDFNSHVRHAGVDALDFTDALICELVSFAGLAAGRNVRSVFFGGGTPSLMPPTAVARVLEALARAWHLSTDAEITLEANPTSAEAANFQGYRAAGVNRLSVGVQALDDGDLARLGRQHNVAEALAAFRLAARIFPRVSFDLIYARPGQTGADWRRELGRALGEQQGHMSLYQLTIEPGTPYHELHRRGALALPDEDAAEALFDITQELTSAHGLAAYEVSNHALPGYECRHNLVYWRYGDYIGIGPGAHGRLRLDDGRRLALSTERHPEAWRARVAAHGHGRVEELALAPWDQGLELLLMGLRLEEGIALANFEQLAGQRLDRSVLAGLMEQGLIQHDEGRGSLATTAKGRKLLNSIITVLASAADRPSIGH